MSEFSDLTFTQLRQLAELVTLGKRSGIDGQGRPTRTPSWDQFLTKFLCLSSTLTCAAPRATSASR